MKRIQNIREKCFTIITVQVNGEKSQKTKIYFLKEQLRNKKRSAKYLKGKTKRVKIQKNCISCLISAPPQREKSTYTARRFSYSYAFSFKN